MDPSPAPSESGRGEQQYIFNEREFEGDDFHAASFVAKYRRVTSLESLRDQLRDYGSGLKDQLYDTINRDYKDFIDIATKLDGVDSRVQHLKKPLIDLRIEALSLHDGIVTSLEAIQQKLRKKSELRQRALLLETTLSCMSKFDDVERLLTCLDPPPRRAHTEEGAGQLTPAGAQGNPRRSDLMRFAAMRESRRIAEETVFKKGEDKAKHQLSYQQTQLTKVLHVLRTQLMKASELERAGHALASAKRSITLLSAKLEQHAVGATAGGRPTGRGESIGGSSSSASVAELSDRASRLEASVISRTHEMLSQVLVSGVPVAAAEADAEASTRMLRRRVLGHVLRTLHVLRRGDVAQSILSENIVYPMARSVLSQGRVDGTGGRGFYAGLEEALIHIVNTLSTSSGVSDLLLLAEDIFASSYAGLESEATDFLVNGVWKPVATLLAERFQGMFSVGVAVAMHRAFTALERFVKEIPLVLLAEKKHDAGDKTFESVVEAAYGRICRHPEVVGFRNKWKLDLYFQLRRQEVTTRLEYALSLLCPAGADNLRSISARKDAATTMDLAYFSEQQPIQAATATVKPIAGKAVPGAAVTAPVAARSVVPRTIAPDVAKSALDDVVASINVSTGSAGASFKLPLVQAIVIEIYSCLHPTVFLAPLAGPFLALIVQLFVRLEAQICAAVPQINPPSFASHEVVMKALQQGSSACAPPSSAAGTEYTTVDDLIDLLGDLMLLRKWMAVDLPSLVFARIKGEGLLSAEAEAALHSAVDKSLAVQSTKTLSLMSGLWSRLSAMICTDCKSGLQAVKAVAGKYRLTNKPPPDAASPFVTTILAPLREFISKYAGSVCSIQSTISSDDAGDQKPWQADIVDDITTAYLQQVQSLVETARQMDSVFMKRSKGAAVAPKSGGASLSDSEKIALQMIFDINAFEQEIKSVDIIDPHMIASFCALHDQVAEMKILFPNLQQ